MGYDVKLSTAAREDLERLPLAAVYFLQEQIEKLALDPVALSVPSKFPYPKGQTFRCQFDHEDVHYSFNVLFKYLPDEKTIWIVAIGIMPPPKLSW